MPPVNRGYIPGLLFHFVRLLPPSMPPARVFPLPETRLRRLWFLLGAPAPTRPGQPSRAAVNGLESAEEIAAFAGDGAMSICAVAAGGRTIIAGHRSGRVQLSGLFKHALRRTPYRFGVSRGTHATDAEGGQGYRRIRDLHPQQ